MEEETCGGGTLTFIYLHHTGVKYDNDLLPVWCQFVARLSSVCCHCGVSLVLYLLAGSDRNTGDKKGHIINES